MKPDEKYMSEVNLKNENNFNFIPPSFNRSFMMNDSNEQNDNNNSYGQNAQDNSNYPNNQNNPNYPYGQNYSNGQNTQYNPNYSNNQGNSNNSYGQNYQNGPNTKSNANSQNNSNGLNNENSNQFLDLYPDETASSELYCYFNSLSGCKNNSQNKNNMANSRIPTTFEVLRDFDLDLDETVDLTRSAHNTAINDILSEIQSKHSGIFDTFSAYNIPEPISKLITKRLIKLSLLYSNKE